MTMTVDLAALRVYQAHTAICDVLDEAVTDEGKGEADSLDVAKEVLRASKKLSSVVKNPSETERVIRFLERVDESAATITNYLRNEWAEILRGLENKKDGRISIEKKFNASAYPWGSRFSYKILTGKASAVHVQCGVSLWCEDEAGLVLVPWLWTRGGKAQLQKNYAAYRPEKQRLGRDVNSKIGDDSIFLMQVPVDDLHRERNEIGVDELTKKVLDDLGKISSGFWSSVGPME